MSLDNSSCNLASLNLLKFLKDDDTFDAERFAQAVELIITAMDISICFADFPTEAIGETTRRLPPARHRLRQPRRPADGDGPRLRLRRRPRDGRGDHLADDRHVLPPLGRARRRRRPLRRLRPQRRGAQAGDAQAPGRQRHGPHARRSPTARSTSWPPRRGPTSQSSARSNGFRNAQASVLAPTGTIGFMMDCDTTGIEPDFSLVKFKKLVGGGSMQIVNQTIPRALRKMGYQPEQVEAIVAYIAEHGHVIDAPGLQAGALRGLRHRDGCPRPQADGPRPDDGGRPAVPLRRDLQDGQPARVRHGRGDRGRLPPVVEARPQGHRDLPRQLQGRPAALRRQVRVLQEGPGAPPRRPRSRPRSSRRSSTPRPASGSRSRAPRAPRRSPSAAPRAT